MPERRSLISSNRIAAVGEGPALILTQELLDQLGVKAGDQVDITVADRTLTVRPLAEAERARLIDEAMEKLIERRRGLYQRLAEGPK